MTALIVSISATVLSVYQAALMRAHDRAEVWPHVELATFVNPTGPEIVLQNTGIGPAIIKSVVVAVDGKPRRNWDEVWGALLPDHPALLSNTTVVEHAVRPGEKVTLVAPSSKGFPPGFWQWIGRVSARVCYASVFNSYWTLNVPRLGGGTSTWETVQSCPLQAKDTDF